MAYKEKEDKLVYIKGKKDLTVGFGKYATKTLSWVAKHDIEFFKQIKDLYYKKYNFFKRGTYDRMSAKLFKNPDLYVKQKQEILDYLIFNRKRGLSFHLLEKDLEKQYKGISKQFLNERVTEVKDLLRKEFEIERDFIIDIHTLRYEELFDKACNPKLDNVPPQYQDSVLAENYVSAIDILAQKEKALGVHSKNFKIQINNFLQAKQRQQQLSKSTNFDVLGFGEQIELLNLIEETRIKDSIAPVILPSEKVENIEITIKDKIEAPVRDVVQEDSIGKKQKEEESKSKSKTLSDIQSIMRENLKQQVKAAFDKNKK